MKLNRRKALFSLGAMASVAIPVVKRVNAEELTSVPGETAMNADHLPVPARVGSGYRVLTNEADRKTLAAVFDRLIPADAHGPSATQAGCLDFLDDQLSGDYGAGKALYLEQPLDPRNEEAIMGAPQFLATPRQRYESGLKALDAYARRSDGVAFADLAPERVDAILEGLEAGEIDLGNGVHGQAFFELMLQNVREGYLADPLYGGNRDMAGWKMIGFPGARYDYRPYIERRGEDLSLAPVSLIPEN